MITQDNINTAVLYNGNSPFQCSLSVTTGASIVIAVAQGGWGGGQSATFNGQSMNLISFESSSSNENTVAFYLLNPGSGTFNLNVGSYGGNYISGVVASYFGVGGVRTASIDKGLNGGTVHSLTPTSQLNDLVIHVIGTQEIPGNLPLSVTLTYATGETERAAQMINQDRRSQINYADKAGAAGTTTVSFQTSFSDGYTRFQDIAFALIPGSPSNGLFMVSD